MQVEVGQQARVSAHCSIVPSNIAKQTTHDSQADSANIAQLSKLLSSRLAASLDRVLCIFSLLRGEKTI